ncbi:adenylate kinase 8 isoform X3 [Pleuronectes platessa]|uniref:adenylate kinase 8 isoform X3 n=1 Tax=Pleuronectes platessa TaxID=8262 RepID=UPI00232A335B|nr:adenylate kinase 8 isoform X3 [Pleuronectes platessa]
MEKMVKPLIPPHMSVYADKHGVFHLLQSLVSSVLTEQPDDPVSYLISVLQRSSLNIPRIMVLGPPAVGKHTVASKLSAELRAVHVTPESLLKDQSELSTQQLPVEQRVHQRLREVDCFNRGWVLEGFPQTRLQALTLQQAGVVPEHVVILEASDDVLLERREGKLVDPLTGDVYHQTFIWQANDIIAQRLEKGRGQSEAQHLAELQRFRGEVTGLRSAYQHVLKIINSDQPHADVYQQVLAFVRTRHRSRTPRILLLGPPGSGKSQQARLLAEKYKMLDVCCDQLISSAAADGSSLGEKIQSYLDDEQPAPDDLVLQVLQRHLSQVDPRRGWILHGFPRDLQGALRLQETQHQPNRVFFLELTDDVCVERISLRATDPVSGERFHAVTRPALSSEIQNRLETRPEDRTPTVTHTLNQCRTHTAALQALESRLNSV